MNISVLCLFNKNCVIPKFYNGNAHKPTFMSVTNESAQTLNLRQAPSDEVVAFVPSVEINIRPFEEMTLLQLERFSWLSMYYSDTIALSIVSIVTSHGLNAWEPVANKVSKIRSLETDSTEYHDALNRFVVIGRVFTMQEVILTTLRVRSDMNLKPYVKNILTNSLHDFFAHHMVLTVLSEVSAGSEDKPKVIGYQAIFNLNCQKLSK